MTRRGNQQLVVGMGILAEYQIISSTSTNAMLKMRADILASVPQYTPDTFSTKTSSILDGSRNYFVLWPLYLVASMDLSTEQIRKWAIRRLRSIGESAGLRQGVALADYLEQRRHIAVWDTKPAPRLPSRGVSEKWLEDCRDDEGD